jgi:hypothetical protein
MNRPIVPMPIKAEVRTMDDVLREMEELTANLAREMDRIRDVLEQKRESNCRFDNNKEKE